MVKQVVTILVVSVSSLLFTGCSTMRVSSQPQSTILPSSIPSNPIESNSNLNPVPTDYSARFEIYTNGTRRIFTDKKYHNQSDDVYIENPDPHLIHIKKSGVTWNDFFSTLPFSLNKECLVTGTKQTFCNTETKKLHFYLNGTEVPDALDRVIVPNDLLRIEYGDSGSNPYY